MRQTAGDATKVATSRKTYGARLLYADPRQHPTHLHSLPKPRPLAVRMPRSLSAAAMPASDFTPAARPLAALYEGLSCVKSLRPWHTRVLVEFLKVRH
jgi:hypothetical protein